MKNINKLFEEELCKKSPLSFWEFKEKLNEAKLPGEETGDEASPISNYSEPMPTIKAIMSRMVPVEGKKLKEKIKNQEQGKPDRGKLPSLRKISKANKLEIKPTRPKKLAGGS